MSPAPELKATLTLPQTAFPMKANLPQNEPLRLKKWASLRLYEKLRKPAPAAPPTCSTTALPTPTEPSTSATPSTSASRTSSSRSKTMAGFDSPYVPGWDCHGLPIEIKVDEQLGRKKLEMPAPAVRHACRDYAQKYIDLQRAQFERIGVFGRWDKPYITMSRDYEARIARGLLRLLRERLRLQGLKPVYWCIHDRTALAEAEVEYEMHTSPAIYVRYELTSDPASASIPRSQAAKSTPSSGPPRRGRSPPRMAVAFHPELRVRRAHRKRRPTSSSSQADPVYIVAAELAPAVIAACNLGATIELARFKGSALERVTFQHPFLDRRSSASSPTTSPPTRAPEPSTPRPRTAQTTSTPASATTSTRPAASTLPGTSSRSGSVAAYVAPALRRQNRLQGQSHHHRPARGARCPARPSPTSSTPTRTAGAATTRSSSAPPSSGSSRMETPDDSAPTARNHLPPARRRRDRQGRLGSRLGQGAHLQHDRHPPRLVHLAASASGACPSPSSCARSCNQPLIDPTLDQQEHRRPLRTRRRRRLVHHARHRSAARRTRRALTAAGLSSARRWTSSTSGSSPAQAGSPSLDVEPELHWPCRPLPRRRRPAPRLVPLLAAHVGRTARPGALLACRHLRLDARRARPRLVQVPRQRRRSRRHRRTPGRRDRPSLGSLGRLPRRRGRQRKPDAALSPSIYRKLRNTFRFLLGNLNDFDPARDRVPEAELLPLDQYMLARTARARRENPRLATRTSSSTASITPSTSSRSSTSARSISTSSRTASTPSRPISRRAARAQTVLWQITEALARLVAPILSFTADEVWEYLPETAGREEQRAPRALSQARRDLLPRTHEVARGMEANLRRPRRSPPRARRSSPGQANRKGARSGIGDRRLWRSVQASPAPRRRLEGNHQRLRRKGRRKFA